VASPIPKTGTQKPQQTQNAAENNCELLAFHSCFSGVLGLLRILRSCFLNGERNSVGRMLAPEPER
jgi:hypothetical protein